MKTAKDLKIPFTWEERRPILMDGFFYLPGHFEHKEEAFPFFSDTKPVLIEFCSGNGQWIGEKAKQNPEFNWIAVEKKFDRARKIWLKIHRESLSNLVVVCGEALLFTRYYAPQAAEIYVNFPDPWPKLRHAKHRLIREEFLNELVRIVPTGGKAICVTDDSRYAEEMEREFTKCSDWKPLFNVHEWPEYGRSFFNDLWVQKGKMIHYLAHKRI